MTDASRLNSIIVKGFDQDAVVGARCHYALGSSWEIYECVAIDGEDVRMDYVGREPMTQEEERQAAAIYEGFDPPDGWYSMPIALEA